MKRLLLVLLLSLNALAAGRDLAPGGFGPTPYPAWNARTAFAGNRFLTVWSEFRGSIEPALMGILHDAHGRRVSYAFPILSLPWFRSIDLTGTGDSFALFWTDGKHTFLTDIDLGGRNTRTVQLDLAPDNWVGTWNGTRFLLSRIDHQDGLVMKIAVLDRSGAVVRPETPLPGKVDMFSTAPMRRGFALMTAGEQGVCVQRIANAAVVEWTSCPSETQHSEAYPQVAATAAGGVVMAWTGTSGELRFATVNVDGSIGPAAIPGVDGTPPLRTVHLSRVDDRYLLLYTREDSRAASQRFVKSMVLDENGLAGRPAVEIAADRGSEVSAASSGRTVFVLFAEPLYTGDPKRIVLDRDGAPAGSFEAVTVQRAQQTQPALADMGSRLFAAWTDAFARDAFVVTASLAPDGDPLFSRAVAPGHLVSRELPSNGSEVLLFSTRDAAYRQPRMQVSFVSPEGSPLGGDPIILGDVYPYRPATASAVWAEDHWLAVWASYRMSDMGLAVLFNHSLARARKLAPGTPLPEGRSRNFMHVALARNATSTLLVWTEELSFFCHETPGCGQAFYRTYAARIDGIGLFIGAPLEVPSSPTSLSVATSGDEFMILTGGTATVIDAKATRVLRSTTVFGWDAMGDVTWDGSSYAVALRYHLARWYLSITHFDRRGNAIGEPRGIETLPADALAPPAIAGSIIALQEGDWTRGARAVVYGEDELLPLPPPPATPVFRFWYSAHAIEVEWDPVPGAELYVVETESNGVWIVPADRPRRVSVPSHRAQVRIIAVGAGGTSSQVRQRSVRH